jgi:hypothetical protein
MAQHMFADQCIAKVIEAESEAHRRARDADAVRDRQPMH